MAMSADHIEEAELLHLWQQQEASEDTAAQQHWFSRAAQLLQAQEDHWWCGHSEVTQVMAQVCRRTPARGCTPGVDRLQGVTSALHQLAIVLEQCQGSVACTSSACLTMSSGFRKGPAPLPSRQTAPSWAPGARNKMTWSCCQVWQLAAGAAPPLHPASGAGAVEAHGRGAGYLLCMCGGLPPGTGKRSTHRHHLSQRHVKAVLPHIDPAGLQCCA